jgi:hypothetical protein
MPSVGHNLLLPEIAWRCVAIFGAMCLCGCTLGRSSVQNTQKLNSLVREQLIIHYGDATPPHSPLLEELLALRTEVAQTLHLPTSEEPIHVYLHDSPQKYADLAKRYFPQGEPRRAFFLETSSRRNVHAQWGEHAKEDLRHELTHAYIHSGVRNIPLWIDEGLAEYFEVAGDVQKHHAEHEKLLINAINQEQWTPDLQRLEQFTASSHMTQIDYAESWLWMHWSLATPETRKLLTDYLHDLRQHGTPTPLTHRIREKIPQPHKSLLEYLGQLTSQ